MRNASFAEVWQRFESANYFLKDYISGLKDEDLDKHSYVIDTISMETFGHYIGHREDFGVLGIPCE